MSIEDLFKSSDEQPILGSQEWAVIIFLSVVGALLLLVVLLLLYLNKIACFKHCDGATCFDVRKDKEKQAVLDEESSDSDEN